MTAPFVDTETHMLLSWECLPALDGTIHAVDPDPDTPFDSYPVSLCGRALVAKGGTVDPTDTCDVCLEVSVERQREYES